MALVKSRLTCYGSAQREGRRRRTSHCSQRRGGGSAGLGYCSKDRGERHCKRQSSCRSYLEGQISIWARPKGFRKPRFKIARLTVANGDDVTVLVTVCETVSDGASVMVLTIEFVIVVDGDCVT